MFGFFRMTIVTCVHTDAASCHEIAKRQGSFYVKTQRQTRGGTGPAKPTPGGNLFLSREHSRMPPVIPAWEVALKNVDPDKRNLITDRTHGAYVLPHPHSFLNDNPRTAATYFYNWLSNRPSWFTRLQKIESSPNPLTNQQWRDFLVSRPSDRVDTKGAAGRQQVRELLGVQVSGIADGTSSPVEWHGHILDQTSPPPDHIAQQILWELFELNFRFELLALDRVASASTDDSHDASHAREQQILQCFPQREGLSALLVADVTLAHRGLGAAHWQERAPYVLALRTVMRGWKVRTLEKPAIIDGEDMPQGLQTSAEIVAMEDAVTRYYTQAFYNFFGRPAVVPHRLDSPSSP